ncbi:NUDIX hydrolase [Streptomyces resistomycificus]|uniref:NUDIX hydrolase n=1 Tax=Streptomyces resistomycificus TaxID=67356 RepID=UPI000AD70F78|nr:NUDIX domain-containing protein [Streptomyces resistomycificus]
MASGPENQGLGKGPRHQIVPRVLVFARSEDSVLLLRGAPDKKIWPGLYNGIGGHIERGEDPLTAAQRELQEESGIILKPDAFRLAALINIDMGPGDPGIMLFTFVAETVEQETGSSEEGVPDWHRIDRLGELPLVEDLPWLIPTVVNETPRGAVRFIRYSYEADGSLKIEETPQNFA